MQKYNSYFEDYAFLLLLNLMLKINDKVFPQITPKNLKFSFLPVNKIVKKELRPNNNVQKIRFK